MLRQQIILILTTTLFTLFELQSIDGLNFGNWLGNDLKLTSSYDQYARNYDALDGGMVAKKLGLVTFRQKVGEFAQGNVLETAIGTGLQLPYYQWSNINEYLGIDLSQGMLDKAKEKISGLDIGDQGKISISQGNVARLSSLISSERKFDTIVDTFSMCVFDDPEQVVAEMRKKLSPSGRIILLENTRSRNPLFAWFQDITSSLVASSSKGCKWNVNVPAITEKLELLPIYSEAKLWGTIQLGVYEIKN